MSLTKISDYMQLSQEDRQKHINLSTPCQFYVYERDYNWRGLIKKEGDLYGKASQIAQAKEELLKLLKIEDFGGHEIHVCHLCSHDSATDKVCVNPVHLYFGTAYENHLDKPLELRQKGGKIGGKTGGKKAAANMTKEQKIERASKGGSIGSKSQLKNKTHNMLKRDTCKYCGHESNVVWIKRAHNDKCKDKPDSVISQDLSSLTPETVSTNLE